MAAHMTAIDDKYRIKRMSVGESGECLGLSCEFITRYVREYGIEIGQVPREFALFPKAAAQPQHEVDFRTDMAAL